MKISKRHRKIFYVPGMISLVVLPVALLFYVFQHQFLQEQYCINLGLPDQSTFKQLSTNYGFPFKRKFKVFDCNGTLESNQAVLKKFQLELRHQNNNKDTINGIKLLLGKKMSYEVYIRILDVLTIEKTPTYMDYHNEIWVFNGNPKRNRMENDTLHTTMDCGTPYYTFLENQRLMNEQKERERSEFMVSYLKDKWFVFLLLLGVAILNIFALIKFNTNTKYIQKSYL